MFCHFLFVLQTGFAQKKTGRVSLQLSWPAFLAKQDLVWDQLPEDYFAGAFVGNGLLGAILFKDDQLPNTLRFEIGRTDVYDHRTLAPSAYETSRLPIGQGLLRPVGTITQVHLRTDLWNAEIRGDLTTTAGTIHFRCFVPSAEELIVLDLKTTGEEKNAIFSFRPQLAQSARYIAKRAMGLEKNVVYEQNPKYQVTRKSGMEIITQTLLMGDDYATAWTAKKNPDDSKTIYLTVANRWGKYRKPGAGSAMDAIATLKAALRKPEAEMEQEHRKWWHHYYPSSFVSLPDARLESFYWIQMYKLGSATHPDRPVIDLLGPWFKPTSWPLLWMNLNVQLTYYTLGITNHPDLEANLYQLLERHKDQMIQNVPRAFQNDCAGIRNPVGYDDLYAPLFLSDDPGNKQELNIIVLPWLMQMYYLYNRRIMDDSALKYQVYPLMRRAFNVYRRILYKGDDGLYHIPYTYSDEYGNAKETSLNIALARWGFATLIETADKLHIRDSLLPVWKDQLKNMADYQTDVNGIMVGKDLPFAKPHRHYSHLFAIFPLYILNIEKDPRRIPLMEKSIEHYTALDGDNCIYKFSGASSLWAALQNGDSALYWLNRSLELLPRFGKPPAPSRIPTLTRNTFYSERENPTFESPISASRSMLDMLLQSWGNKIRIFPSMPSDWKEASFYQLRTEGAFLVSAKRSGGKTIFIHIKSLAGAPCVIETDLSPSVKIFGISPGKMKVDGKTIRLSLKKGEEAVLYSGDKPADFSISQVSNQTGSENFWGVHKN